MQMQSFLFLVQHVLSSIVRRSLLAPSSRYWPLIGPWSQYSILIGRTPATWRGVSGAPNYQT